MPDANTKVLIGFEATGGTAPTGWTETWYSPTMNLDSAADEMVKKYVPKRAALLGVGARIQFVRTTNVGVKRLSSIRFVTGKEGEPSLFTTQGKDDYDPTQVDLLCRLQTFNGHRRQLAISGLPDSQTDQLIAQGIFGDFINAPVWKQYVAAIIQLGLQIRYKATNGPPPTFNATEVTSVQPIMVRNRKRGRPFFLFRGRRTV